MSRHRRRVRLLAIFARLGWQRDPDLWTIPCLDGQGRRTQLSVRVGLGWVTLDCTAPGPLYLAPFEALRLRAAVREVVLDLKVFGGTEPSERLAQTESTPHAPAALPRRNLVVYRRPPPRPTVADIAARLAAPTATHDQDADCDEHSARAPHLAGLAA